MKSFKEDKIQPFEPAIYVQEGDSLENYGIQAEIIELSRSAFLRLQS